MAEPQWHCYYDRTQDGPLVESVLVRRFGERLVPLHALVWSDAWRNASEWRPAREIDAFRRAATGPVLAPPLAVPVRPAVVAPVMRVPVGSPVRVRPAVVRPAPARVAAPSFVPPVPRRAVPSPTVPPRRLPVPPGAILPPPGTWERFWARALDLAVLGNGLYALLVEPLLPALPGEGVFFVRCVAATLLWMLLETVLLQMFGTTPGKWAFDIQIQTLRGDLPGYGQSMRRCAWVFFLGLGAAVLPFAIFGMVVAYNQLLMEGQTAWDRSTGLTVVRRGSGWLGWGLLTLGLCAGAWMLVVNARP